MYVDKTLDSENICGSTRQMHRVLDNNYKNIKPEQSYYPTMPTPINWWMWNYSISYEDFEDMFLSKLYTWNTQPVDF